MSVMKKMKKYLTDKKARVSYNNKLGLYRFMPDEKFLKKIYKLNFGKELDLENPTTFNEKLQWLKLHDRKPEYTMMADKYAVREYIKERIGEEYLIPLIGVYDNPNEIDFDKLPEQFVLKCNHNSGTGMYICKDKSKLTEKDKKNIRRNLAKGLRENYYLHGREWPYKDIPRKIVCEKYMTDGAGCDDFTDYKFFCFDGNAVSVMMCLDRSSGDTKYYFFDKGWKLQRLNIRGREAPQDFSLPKPECIDKMFDIAEILSKEKKFVRVDLYQSDGQVYFGEMTFFPDSGFDANLLPETDKYFGNLLKLS